MGDMAEWQIENMTVLDEDPLGRALAAEDAKRERERARRRARPLEADIQKRILAFLRREGVFHWRQNVGGFQDRTGRWVSFGVLGLADIIGIEPGTGRFLAIEVKRRGEGQTARQRRFQERVEAAGGLYILARSVDDVREKLNARDTL